MQSLYLGQFYGETNRRIALNGLMVTDTAYTHQKVDWHYHENPYFTFILQGNLFEGNSHESYHCTAGSLLFHNWDNAHYNIKPPGYTRGFHIEIEQQWLDRCHLNIADLRGSFSIKNPAVKLIFYKLFQESLLPDTHKQLTIESLLLASFSHIKNSDSIAARAIPYWLNPLRELLHEEYHKQHSLAALSALFGVHPVHLSRYFPKFFGCTIGEYIRKVKVEKSLRFLADKDKTLVEVALEAGFADQSHFSRCFKQHVGTTPLMYRQLFSS